MSPSSARRRPVPALALRNPAWDSLGWLRAASTTRPYAEGASDKREVAARLAGEFLGDPGAFACGGQCHGSRVEWIAKDAALERPAVYADTDGFATDRPGLMLACFTADCVPVLVVDPVERAIGSAHAGWRGTRADIAGELVRTLAERGSKPENLQAWIAPAIGGAVYEVSPELAAEFAEAFPDWAGEIVRGRLLDLPRLNALELERAGLAPGNIARSPHCTYGDPELFFSYRRDGTCGPHLCAGLAIAG